MNTSNWLGGHDVLVPLRWIDAVSWPEAKVSVDLTRQAVKDAPPYNAAAHLDREQEQAMHEHHGRPGYWTIEAANDVAARSATRRDPDAADRDV